MQRLGTQRYSGLVCRSLARRLQRGATSIPKESPLEYYYFGLWARTAVPLSLEHSGLPWKYIRPSDWKAMKPTCDWAVLPVLKNLPAECGLDQLAQEATILDFVAEAAAANGDLRMKGKDKRETLISKQLVGVGEDIYQKLGYIRSNFWTAEEASAFWDRSKQDALGHNKTFGVFVFLDKLEQFYAKVGGSEGKFTSSGCTVGECKLWATLHALKLIDPDIFEAHPHIKAFYERVAAEPATKAIVSGEKTGGKLAIHFLKTGPE